MPTLGEKLRQERQKQNRTLAEIASKTCISSRYLQAIENNAFEELPGGMFAKSFIKQYCNALGISPESLESDINAALPSQEEPDPLPALSENYQVPRLSGSGGIKTSWLVVLFVAAIAGSSGFYAWWQKLQQRHPVEETAAQPVPQPVQEARNSPPPPQPQQEPVAQPPATATPIPEVPAPVDPSKLKLNLQATERTWVSLTAGGRTVFAGVLDVSEQKEVEGLENAKLVTGNAAGLEVHWNGKPLGPLGNRGQVRTIIFTPQKYEFVVPVPKKPASTELPDQRPTGVGD